MTTLRDLRDLAQHKFVTGKVTEALKIYRLVLEGEPSDFQTRLKIADCLLLLGERKLAGAVYTSVAVYGIKAGLPLMAFVAIKCVTELFPQLSGLAHDLAALYSKDSPRVGRGVRPSPADLSAKVRDGIDLNYEIHDEELRKTTAQMAAYIENFQEFPKRVPPVPFFSELSTEAFEHVIGALQLQRLVHGDMVVKQGDPGDSFFVVAQGKVRVFRDKKDGTRQVLATLGEGSILGEMAVLAAEPRTASVDVEGEADILVFSRSALAAMAQDLPQIAPVLERFATDRMVNNLLNTNPFFEPFNDEQKRELLKRFEAHNVPQRAVIVRQNEEGRGIYLILHGAVEVVRTEQTGTQIPLATLQTGDCFGEISCIQDRPTTAKVTALKDSTVMFLPKEYFQKLTEAVPSLGEYYVDLSVERLMELKKAAEMTQPRIIADDGSIRL